MSWLVIAPHHASRITTDGIAPALRTAGSAAPHRGHEHRPRQRLHGSACFFCVQRCMHTDSCGTRHTCWFCFRKSRPGSTTSCGAAYRSLQSPARNLQPPAAKITRDGSPSDTGGNKGRWLPASFQGALSLHEAIVDMAIP